MKFRLGDLVRLRGEHVSTIYIGRIVEHTVTQFNNDVYTVDYGENVFSYGVHESEIELHYSEADMIDLVKEMVTV